MSSVTQVVATIKQPYGGYLPIKLFSKETFDDGLILNETENISSGLVGLAVDYLTRFIMGDPLEYAFAISCAGASIIGEEKKARSLLRRIKGLDDVSIKAACKIVGYDVCFRKSTMAYKSVDEIKPDRNTIENIRIMISRSISFWNKYGPIVMSGPTFDGGYTNIVSSGDGDYMSCDTLWDFKVSKSDPTSKHSLQLLMYYIMGMHSIHKQFKTLTNLGFFNPRLNIAYICPISSIPVETISVVETNVIGYGAVSTSHNPYNLPTNVGKTEPDEYSVADICDLTGLKKSKVYEDIHKGYLHAHKKGNKYYIYKANYYEYLKYLKTLRIIPLCVFGALLVAFLIYLALSLKLSH